ncbi:MAG: hypothetical protein A3H93_00505 [Rhodocyclales bacterium RIFCSPLOWO2_02_FULL_63_24]|nr:MAG: hypothetical protein A3H93_00505 [Rhodocyclales bacterium RIFCSPLOWO2_02_FULL_63_24]
MPANADEKRPGHSEALIGAGTVVAGDILFSGGLRIDGEVRGNVRSLDGQTGTLVIGEKGRVDGNIEVVRLIVNGLVTGRVDAKEFVRFQSKAQVNSDVEYAVAEIHSGAVIQGRLLQRPAAAEV